MFDVLSDINWFSVLLAFVASTLIAGVWFTAVVAKPYLVALGRDADTPAPEGDLVRNLGPVACMALTTITSAVLIYALDMTAIGDAVLFGLIVGVGYLSAMTFQIAINPNFPRPLFYGLLNAPFFILTSVVASVIIVAMR